MNRQSCDIAPHAGTERTRAVPARVLLLAGLDRLAREPGRREYALSRRGEVVRHRDAFTLIELLVVIGIIALLISILIPALALAKEAGNSAVCASNLRQLFTASMNYALDQRNYWPPADLDFVTVNNHRWHGTRPDNVTSFDFAQSELKPYLQTAAIKQCPSFTFVEGSVGFEQACGGYGYNNSYLGSSSCNEDASTWSLPPDQIDAVFSNVPAKTTMIHRPAEKLAFGDAAIANPALIEYSFLEPPTNSFGQNSPSIHFRHRGKANVCWADGHVTSERMDWTYPINVYGANNKKMRLGWFGPRDNSLFARE